MEKDQVKRVVETLLYMTDHALSAAEISSIVELKAWDDAAIAGVIKEIGDQLTAQGSPLRVVEVAGGYQMATQPDMAPWIRRMYKERLTVKLSPSSLETLAIIAYKQPITRGEIEQIRGVEASGVMDTLVERRLVKIVGRKETIGRPLLYGTTPDFLRHFGLKHLSELPDLSQLAATLNAAEAASTEPQAELPMAEDVNEATEIASAEVPPPSELPESTPEAKELKEEVLVAENEGMTNNA
jgi:segregation and condensation protein B